MLVELESRGIDSGVVQKLVVQLTSSESLERRSGLLDILCDNPTAVQVYQDLKKRGIRNETYITFLRNAAGLMVGDETLFGIVARVTESNHFENAELLIERGAELLSFEGQRQTIIDICMSNRDGYVPVRDYLAYKRAGNENRASLSLDLALAKLPQKELKALRNKLGAIPEGELDMAASGLDARTRIERLVKYRQGRQQGTPAREPTKANRDWYQIMSGWMRECNLPNKVTTTVDTAFGVLTERSLEYRLHDVWLNYPKSLELFCLDVISLSSRNGYLLILRDNDLFRAYAEGFCCDTKRDDMLRIIDSKNPYPELKKILTTKATVENIGDANTGDGKKKEAVHTVSPKKYKRVIVFGGTYRDDECESLNRRAGIQVVVYDESQLSRKCDANVIQHDDCVVFISNHAKHHRSFQHLRERCTSIRAQVHICNHTNINLVLELINRVTGNGE